MIPSRISKPKVSVVVPSFNAQNYLAWTLESIAAQSLSDFECIVVDDASTDRSFKECSSFFKDPRFTLIKHRINIGLAASRNTGLRAAQADFVAFLDADDLMMADSLETRLNSCLWGVRKSDRLAGSYCGSAHIDESTRTAPSSDKASLGFVDFVSSEGLCPFNANQPMIRRDLLRLAGGFNERLNQAEDFDLWQRLLRAGYWFAPTKHRSVTYRQRSSSMIRSAPLTHLKTALSIINSTSLPLDCNQLGWSPYRMPKALGDYTEQKRKLKRIMEFAGMSLAASEPCGVSDLKELIFQEIPDVRSLLHPAQTLDQLILAGVRRQVLNVNAEHEQRVTSLVRAIADSECTSTRFSNATSRPFVVYDDPAKDRVWLHAKDLHTHIAFIPHSPYHVWTISLLAPHLTEAGISFVTVDLSAHWRDTGIRAASLEHGVDLISLNEFILSCFKVCSVAVFNDWDPVTRPLIAAAKDAGLKTIAIVEGIQDYDDVDVHWRRYAYKSADTVLLPGAFDRRYFSRHKAALEVVGIPRIDHLMREPLRSSNERPAKTRVLINSNFSYGVLEQHRDAWVTDCVEVVRELGMEPIISRHMADKGELFPEHAATKSFYETLEQCDVTIQRFASGILEALARSVGIIYYNPHREKVDKFQDDPMGAYVLAFTKNDLRIQLEKWRKLQNMASNQGKHFLQQHALPTDKLAPQEACSIALARHSNTSPSRHQKDIFRANLEAIDLTTCALTVSKPNGAAVFETPDEFAKILKALRDKHLSYRFTELSKAQSKGGYRASLANTNSLLAEQNADHLVTTRANQLFHEERYAECIPLYLAASRRLSSRTFAFSAQLAIRRLGARDEDLACQILRELTEHPTPNRSTCHVRASVPR